MLRNAVSNYPSRSASVGQISRYVRCIIRQIDSVSKGEVHTRISTRVIHELIVNRIPKVCRNYLLLLEISSLLICFKLKLIFSKLITKLKRILAFVKSRPSKALKEGITNIYPALDLRVIIGRDSDTNRVKGKRDKDKRGPDELVPKINFKKSHRMLGAVRSRVNRYLSSRVTRCIYYREGNRPVSINPSFVLYLNAHRPANYVVYTSRATAAARGHG